MSGGVYYSDYLKLDALLDAQAPESERLGQPAHDELLFIVTHQAYELWFKQILHELDRIQADFSEVPMRDTALGRIAHGLHRIKSIFDLVVRQIDVLETMTPLDFLDFRDLLRPASGFQSLQFRMIETRLGLKTETRLDFGGKSFEERLSETDRAKVRRTMEQPSLIEQLAGWLERTPFVRAGGYAFAQSYRDAVTKMLQRDRDRIATTEGLTPEQRQREQKAIDTALADFQDIFDSDARKGHWRMSTRAVQAALFIVLYRDEPVLQTAHRMIELLMDIDEAMTMWRYRHAVMVERMIGVKLGTGGSAGHSYLRATAERHRVFTDLFRLSTYLIPRSLVPPLPPELKARMGFAYADGGAQ